MAVGATRAPGSQRSIAGGLEECEDGLVNLAGRAPVLPLPPPRLLGSSEPLLRFSIGDYRRRIRWIRLRSSQATVATPRPSTAASGAHSSSQEDSWTARRLAAATTRS